MGLPTGFRLGSYEVTASIGRGGMGEVYRARDTRLNRDVALKILPEAFARDPDRLARFQREAQVLASLNHPHISGIYGFEEGPPVNGVPVGALVLELVEGPTLADRIAQGPIPLDETLPIARQIAEALEAAHQSGVVHRDLKPANIKLRPDGTVKVLDFGLAKALEPAPAASGLSLSPTMASPAMLTDVGVLLGTAAYMSPEQARGQNVDPRTDLFAFGCVLYEMLAGRAAFPGDSVSDVVASVLRSEPDWGRLPADTPASVHRVLRRCLRKDRSARLHSAGDARIEIEEARAEPEHARLAAVAAPRRRDVLKWITGGAGGIVVGGGLGAWAFRRPSTAAETRVVDILTPPTPDPLSFALSPDGRSLVFVAGEQTPQLWLRSLTTGIQQPLPGTEGATHPFWKPDSRSVGFAAGGRLKRVDVADAGGAPLTLANTLFFRGGAWHPSGVILFTVSGGSRLYRVPDTPGGEAAPFTNLAAGHSNHRFARFLPGSRQFLVYVQGAAPVRGIYLGSLDSGQIQRVVDSDTAGDYLAGWLMFVRDGTLLAQRLDTESGTPNGDLVKVATPVGVDGATGLAAFSVSAAGSVAFRAKGATARQLIWFDQKGTNLGPFGPQDETGLTSPEICPTDSSRVAVDRTDRGNQNVWILEPNPQPFTSGAGVSASPLWSPDGKWIVFRSNRGTSTDLYLKPSRSIGDETLLLQTLELKVPTDWYGDSLLFYSIHQETGLRSLWVLRVTDGGRHGSEPKALNPNKSWDESNGQFSPDGRHIAYQSDESKQTEIYVAPLSGKARPRQVSTGGGIWPRWSHGGRKLYYLRSDGMLMAAAFTERDDELAPSDARELFRPRILSTAVSNRFQYDVDGLDRFLINTPVEGAVPSPITLILNWKPPDA